VRSGQTFRNRAVYSQPGPRLCESSKPFFGECLQLADRDEVTVSATLCERHTATLSQHSSHLGNATVLIGISRRNGFRSEPARFAGKTFPRPRPKALVMDRGLARAHRSAFQSNFYPLSENASPRDPLWQFAPGRESWRLGVVGPRRQLEFGRSYRQILALTLA
jgi:hypothetical protein